MKWTFGNMNNMYHLGYDKSRALMRKAEKHNLTLINKLRGCGNVHSQGALIIDGMCFTQHDSECYDDFVANYKL